VLQAVGHDLREPYFEQDPPKSGFLILNRQVQPQDGHQLGKLGRISDLLSIVLIVIPKPRTMMKQIKSFLSELKKIYNQQGQIGKILLPSLVLLIVCCLCSALVSLARPRSSPNPVASPIVLPSQGSVATPTALFNFGTVTFAPFPTFPSSTALPTLTASVTGVPTSTPDIPTTTGTAVPLPTLTASQPPSPTTVVVVGSVQIAAVDKAKEFVDIQNGSNVPVDLGGWKLVSETGSQVCPLQGMLQPNETLRVWSGKGDSGLNCEFRFNIWNDNQSDPAVLYNAQGQEISRFP